MIEDGIIRNPAYNNPPSVGYKLKKTPKGYTYPSILMSNTINIDGLIEAIINW